MLTHSGFFFFKAWCLPARICTAPIRGICKTCFHLFINCVFVCVLGCLWIPEEGVGNPKIGVKLEVVVSHLDMGSGNWTWVCPWEEHCALNIRPTLWPFGFSCYGILYVPGYSQFFKYWLSDLFFTCLASNFFFCSPFSNLVIFLKRDSRCSFPSINMLQQSRWRKWVSSRGSSARDVITQKWRLTNSVWAQRTHLRWFNGNIMTSLVVLLG